METPMYKNMTYKQKVLNQFLTAKTKGNMERGFIFDFERFADRTIRNGVVLPKP